MSRKSSTDNQIRTAAEQGEQVATTLWNGATSAVTDSMQAQQKLLRWMTEAQQVQLRNLQQWSQAVQSGVDTASQARDWGAMVAAQNELLSQLTAQAVRAQNEQMSSWLSLQAELAQAIQKQATQAADAVAPGRKAEGAGGFDPAQLYEQARANLDAWMRQWSDMFKSEPATH